MLLEERKANAVLVVDLLEQHLDASVANEFRDQMKRLIENGNRLLVIGLNNVEFVDSSGLGAIVSTRKLLGRDGRMVVYGTNQRVSSLFKLTRMDKVFRMFQTEDQAVTSLTN